MGISSCCSLSCHPTKQKLISRYHDESKKRTNRLRAIDVEEAVLGEGSQTELMKVSLNRNM